MGRHDTCLCRGREGIDLSRHARPSRWLADRTPQRQLLKRQRITPWSLSASVHRYRTFTPSFPYLPPVCSPLSTVVRSLGCQFSCQNGLSNLRIWSTLPFVQLCSGTYTSTLATGHFGGPKYQ